MRITSVDIFGLGAPLDAPFFWATGAAWERQAVLIRINTDRGIEGWGEALYLPTATVIRDFLSPVLIGRDPLERCALVELMRTRVARSRQLSTLNVASVGAAEMALWDIAAKSREQPLHRLLGKTMRDRVAVYASGLYYKSTNPPDGEQEACEYLERGFTRVKMKVGRLSVAEDLKRVAAVREAVGAKVPLMADANQGYDLDSATRMSLGLRELDVRWLEEPLPTRNIFGYGKLKTRTMVPIAAGERFSGLQSFQPFFASRLLEVAQPNVGNVGGLEEALTVAHQSHAAGLRVAFHHWGTPVALAASLHLAACVPSGDDSPLVEIDCTPNPLRAIVAEPVLSVSGGAVKVPDGPGLGVELDESNIERFCRRT